MRKNCDLQAAISRHTEAIRLNPKDPCAYFKRASIYQEARCLDKAIADYSEAIRLGCRASHAYVYRGFAYASKGEEDKAINDYGEAIRLNPNEVDAYHGRGCAARAKGRPKQGSRRLQCQRFASIQSVRTLTTAAAELTSKRVTLTRQSTIMARPSD